MNGHTESKNQKPRFFAGRQVAAVVHRLFFEHSTIRQLLRHPMGAIGIGLLLLVGFAAVFAPVIAPYDPSDQLPQSALVRPSLEHFFGTDHFGRDVFSRVVFGSRTAFFIALISVAIGATVGVSGGLIAGYRGGLEDAVILRLSDVLLAFPGLLLGLLVVVALGPGAVNVALALGIGAIPIFARLTRGQVLALRERDYVKAAKMYGASATRVMLHHLLRNAASPILVQVSLVMGFSVLLEAGLSFLGLGVQPPQASWGRMLSESRPFFTEQLWFALGPGIALCIFILGLVFLSDALRDVLQVGEE